MSTDVQEVQPIARAIVQANSSPTPADLLRIAVESGADLDRLERLMDLQERWQRGEAQKAYNEAFTAFKGEAVKIIKNTTIKAGPLNGRKYASLKSVVDAITPALSANGLAATWRLSIDRADWIEVCCTLRHIGGHSESVTMGGPPDVGGAKNAIQARASTVSYLERYTIKAICGVAEEEDDDDGGSAGPGKHSEGGPAPKVDRTALMKARRAIADALANGRDMGALSEWEAACEAGEEFSKDVWAGLTSDNREELRRLRNEANA